MPEESVPCRLVLVDLQICVMNKSSFQLSWLTVSRLQLLTGQYDYLDKIEKTSSTNSLMWMRDSSETESTFRLYEWLESNQQVFLQCTILRIDHKDLSFYVPCALTPDSKSKLLSSHPDSLQLLISENSNIHVSFQSLLGFQHKSIDRGQRRGKPWNMYAQKTTTSRREVFHIDISDIDIRDSLDLIRCYLPCAGKCPMNLYTIVITTAALGFWCGVMSQRQARVINSE